MIFGREDPREIIIIKCILLCIEAWSEFKINFHKSSLYFCEKSAYRGTLFWMFWAVRRKNYMLNTWKSPLKLGG